MKKTISVEISTHIFESLWEHDLIRGDPEQLDLIFESIQRIVEKCVEKYTPKHENIHILHTEDDQEEESDRESEEK